jgi:hypothetical protein
MALHAGVASSSPSMEMQATLRYRLLTGTLSGSFSYSTSFMLADLSSPANHHLTPFYYSAIQPSEDTGHINV